LHTLNLFKKLHATILSILHLYFKTVKFKP
jgi:hypothetical protein